MRRECKRFYGRVHASEQAARLGAGHQAQALRADAAEPHAADLGGNVLEGAAAVGAVDLLPRLKAGDSNSGNHATHD